MLFWFMQVVANGGWRQPVIKTDISDIAKLENIMLCFNRNFIPPTFFNEGNAYFNINNYQYRSNI
jgi:hypothetical protein